jgi:hypothetical protein
MIEYKGSDMYRQANIKLNKAKMHLLQVLSRTTDCIVNVQNYLQVYEWALGPFFEPFIPINHFMNNLVVIRRVLVVLTRWFRLSLLLAISCLTLSLLLVIARVMIVT